MKSNADKCDLLVSTSNKVNIKIDNFDRRSSKCEKNLLGVKFDHKLTFDDHISELCKNASRNVHALVKVTPYMNISKRRILVNAFLTSQFRYYPLTWMYCIRNNNRKINCLHVVACESFIRTNSHHLNSYLKKTIMFLFIR